VERIVREINGKLAAPAGQRGLPTLRLDAGKKQASGFSGVNRFFGGYERTGEKLKFGMLAGTMMAGPEEHMATETAFLQALQSVSGWRMNKADLELLNGEKVVLRFSVGAAAK
jgi:heat shock protein HslJ